MQEDEPAARKWSSQRIRVKPPSYLPHRVPAPGGQRGMPACVAVTGHHHQHEPPEKCAGPSNFFMAEPVDNKVAWGNGLCPMGGKVPCWLGLDGPTHNSWQWHKGMIGLMALPKLKGSPLPFLVCQLRLGGALPTVALHQTLC